MFDDSNKPCNLVLHINSSNTICYIKIINDKSNCFNSVNSEIDDDSSILLAKPLNTIVQCNSQLLSNYVNKSNRFLMDGCIASTTIFHIEWRKHLLSRLNLNFWDFNFGNIPNIFGTSILLPSLLVKQLSKCFSKEVWRITFELIASPHQMNKRMDVFGTHRPNPLGQFKLPTFLDLLENPIQPIRVNHLARADELRCNNQASRRPTHEITLLLNLVSLSQLIIDHVIEIWDDGQKPNHSYQEFDSILAIGLSGMMKRTCDYTLIYLNS